MASDAEIVIGIRGEVGGAKVIKRSLDDVANSGDRTRKSIDDLDTAFNKTTRRMLAAEARLKDLALAGKQNTDRFKRLQEQTDKYRTSLDRAERSIRSVSDQTDKAAKSTRFLADAFKLFLATVGVREIIRAADQFTLLNARIENSTRSAEEYVKVMTGLRRISGETGASLQSAVEVFQRLSFTRDEIQATADEMIAFTGSVQKLGVVSGASTQALNAGLTQLGQALSSDVTRAEEFNSILENIPAVAVAISKEFGVTTGQLRNLVIEGEVVSKDVFAAILNQTKDINEQFDRFPQTIGRAFNNFILQAQEAVNKMDQLSAGTQVLIEGLRISGHVLEALVGLLQGFGSTLKAFFSIVVAGIIDAVNKAAKIVEGTINLAIEGINLLRKDDLELVKFTSDISTGDLADAAMDQARNELNQAKEGFENAFESTVGLFNKGAESTLVKQEVASRELSKNYADLAKNISDGNEESKKGEKIQSTLNALVRETATEQERYNMRIEELEKLRGHAETAEQITAINRAIKEAGEELEEFKLQAELDSPLAKTFARLASEIEDGFKDAFKSAFTATEGGWKKLVEGFKNTFKNLLAELAYQALARPIVVSVLAAGGTAAGLSNSAVAQTLGMGGGGSGGMGGMGSLISNGFSAIRGGLNTPMFGANSFIGSGINNIGASLGLNNGGFIGPMMPGTSNLASAFTPMAGIAGFGGNMLANAIFGGDRGIGSTIGGTLGGIGGTAVGASMGTILGMAGGPVGALIGAFAGNALGGLFGGSKPSDKVQTGGINLGTGERFKVGGFTGKKFSQENADFRDAVLDEADKLASLLRTFGAELEGKLFLEIGSRDGLRVNGSNYGDDADAFIEAVMSRVAGSATGLNATSQTILDNVGFKDTQKLAAALQFGQEYDAFIAPQSDKSQLQQALDNLDAQFSAMSDTASELGLSVGKLTTVYNKQKQALRDDFIANIENAILAIKDPALLAAKQLEEQFDAMRSDADALGVDKTKLEELYDLRQKILKAEEAGFSNLKDLADNLLDFLDQQKFSADSSLSPTEKLAAAQDKFGSVLSDAQGGDFAAIGQLTGAASTLLDTARDVYASSVSFAGIEQFVRSSLESIGKEMDLPGFASGTHSAPQGMAWVGERGPELVNFKGGEQVIDANQSSRMGSQTNALLSEIVEQNKELVRDNKLLRKQLERVSNKMAVRG